MRVTSVTIHKHRFLQSEIDACCAALKTSTGFLQSEIDAVSMEASSALLQAPDSYNQRLMHVVQRLQTSTGFLQSEIDSVIQKHQH